MNEVYADAASEFRLNREQMPMPPPVNVDLNLIRVFDAIYARRSLTKAADALCVTQPAVSHALTRLRELYDDPLFVRTLDGMIPTPTAEEIAPLLKDALRSVAGSLERTIGFRPESTVRRFRFNMMDGVEAIVLPRILPLLQSEAPHMSVETCDDPRRDTLKELIGGQTDFAIDCYVPDDARVQHVLLLEDEFVCAVRKHHPITRAEFTLDQFLAQGHIHVGQQKCGVGAVDTALSGLGVQRRIVVQTPHCLQAQFAAATSDLVLTTIRSLTQLAELVVLPVPLDIPPLAISLYWSSSFQDDPAHRWMRRRIVEQFQPQSNSSAAPVSARARVA